MRFTMSTDEKKTAVDVPTFVVSQPEVSEKKSRRKYVIIAISGVVVAALILTAILVGMYMFTEAEKEILQYSLQLNKDMKQDVTSNPNTNTVQYHVQEKDQEVWVVNDYNADISVMKIQSKTETNCYVTPLNESNPNNLPQMQSDTSHTTAGTQSLVYKTGGHPIPDTSFLSKTARDTCSGVSTYWLYPECEPIQNNIPPNMTAPSGGGSRSKRTPIVCLDSCNCYYANYYAYCGCYQNNFFFSLGLFRYTCVFYPATTRTAAYYLFTLTGYTPPNSVYYGTKRCVANPVYPYSYC